MEKNLRISALIPARSGSKGLPDKNIKEYHNSPLLCHSIRIAKQSKYITDIIVSTDSERYKEIAEKNGAKCPFLRPKSISGDLSTDYEFVKHYIQWIQLNDSKNMPHLVIQLRPTYPNRKLEDLNNMIEIMIKQTNYTSLRTVIPNTKSPFKMYLNENNVLKPLFEDINGLKEPYNLCRQDLPVTYLHNGCVDIIRVSSFIKENSITGSVIYPYIMNEDETDDIDTIKDWNISESK